MLYLWVIPSQFRCEKVFWKGPTNRNERFWVLLGKMDQHVLKWKWANCRKRPTRTTLIAMVCSCSLMKRTYKDWPF
jgi:hypothetical protein